MTDSNSCGEWNFDGYFLRSPDSNLIWPARSGGIAGNSPNVSYGSDGKALRLPPGQYFIEKGIGVEKEEMKIPGRKWGWWIPLRPLFETDRGKPGRGMFGIHPDGGPPGTDGCIGIISGDYMLLFNMLQSGKARYLRVKYTDGR